MSIIDWQDPAVNDLFSVTDWFATTAGYIENAKHNGGGDGGKVASRNWYLSTNNCLPRSGS